MSKLEELREALQEEVPKHQRLQAATFDPTILLLISNILMDVLPAIVKRCSDENPIEEVASALNSPNPRVRNRTERILRANVYDKMRKDDEYERLYHHELRGSVPTICVDSLRAVSEKRGEEDREELVDEVNADDKDSDYSLF